MSLTFSQIRPGMPVSATHKMTGEVHTGTVVFTSKQLTMGGQNEGWLGLDQTAEMGGDYPIQNHSFKYWKFSDVDPERVQENVPEIFLGGSRRKRRQSKRSRRYTKKK